MTPGGSVSVWIQGLKAGDEAALAKLHKRYWPYVVAIARRKLHGMPSRGADEEDVAQEALWRFFRSLRSGQIPRLENRHDLLALLTHITSCQAINQLKHEFGVQKRGEGRTRGESALDVLAAEEGVGRGIEQVPHDEPTPLESAILHDRYRRFVNGLPENLHRIAEAYLANCTCKEIAEQMGCAERTAERKVALILARWRQMAAESMQEST